MRGSRSARPGRAQFAPPAVQRTSPASAVHRSQYPARSDTLDAWPAAGARPRVVSAPRPCRGATAPEGSGMFCCGCRTAREGEGVHGDGDVHVPLVVDGPRPPEHRLPSPSQRRPDQGWARRLWAAAPGGTRHGRRRSARLEEPEQHDVEDHAREEDGAGAGDGGVPGQERHQQRRGDPDPPGAEVLQPLQHAGRAGREREGRARARRREARRCGATGGRLKRRNGSARRPRAHLRAAPWLPPKPI